MNDDEETVVLSISVVTNNKHHIVPTIQIMCDAMKNLGLIGIDASMSVTMPKDEEPE